MRTISKSPPSHRAFCLHQSSSKFRNQGYRLLSPSRRSTCRISLSGCSLSHGTCRWGRRLWTEPGLRSRCSRQLFSRPGLSKNQSFLKLLVYIIYKFNWCKRCKLLSPYGTSFMIANDVQWFPSLLVFHKSLTSHIWDSPITMWKLGFWTFSYLSRWV